jgi:hypothetical protein
MADFPRIKPTTRSFTMGQYPTKIYRALSGRTIRRSFGSRPFGATLDLTFENVPETVLSAIYSHYHGQKGDSIGFGLPLELLAGLPAAATITAQLRQGSPFSGMVWFYAESPSVENTFRNLSTISVQLVAEFA